MIKMEQKLYRILLAVWTIVIFLISTTPHIPGTVKVIPFIDELTHFSEFFILGFLLLKSFPGSSRKNFYLLILSGLGYSIFTETCQIFVPGRFFEFYDVLINSLGLLGGFFLPNQLNKLSGSYNFYSSKFPQS